MTMFKLATAATLVALLQARAAWAEPTPTMVANTEVAFITFVAGEPLSADERRRIAVGVLRDLAANPPAVLAAYASEAAMLGRVAHDPALAIKQRRSNRLAFNTASAHPATDNDRMEFQIVADHDPVVAYDPARNILFTRRTVADLHAAAAWAANLAGVPGPGPDFDARLAASLPRALPAMSPKLAGQMTEVASTQFYARAWPRDGGAAAIARDRPALRASLSAPATDPTWCLATGASVISDLLANHEINLAKRTLSRGNAAMGNLARGNVARQMQLGNQRNMGYACMHQQASVSYCQGGAE